MIAKKKKQTTKKRTVRKKKPAFDFPGEIKIPFPVEVLWDDAYRSMKTHYSIDSIIEECTGPIWSLSYGKLIYASRDEIIIAYFLHIDNDGTINATREPQRVALSMVYKIVNLGTGEIIHEKKSKKKANARKN